MSTGQSLAHRVVNIPHELRALPHWIVYALVPDPAGGKPKKIPYNPGTSRRARVNDRLTWRSFDDALADAERTGRHPGVVLTPSSGITLIDIDDHNDHRLVAALDSYSERSISGNGLHIIVRGRPPAGFVAPVGVEIYPRDGNRGVLITGDIINGRSTIAERSAELAVLCPPKAPPPLAPAPTLNVADDAVLARAHRMSGFAPLFDHGDLAGYGGDHSRADLACLNYLITAGATDPDQLDRLLRASALMRSKWDRSDYRSRTIERALNGNVQPFAGWQPPARPENGAVTRKPQDAGFVPDADVAACPAYLAAATRRIRELEAALAAAEARADAAEAKVALLSDVQSRTAGILRNRKLSNERFTAVALVNFFANRAAAGDPGDNGLHALPLARLGDDSGVSPDTASAHIAKLVDAGLVRKEVRWHPEAVNRETGEIIPGHRRQYIGPATNVIDFATAVATLDPTTPKNWGGKRTSCPDHPHADTIKRWTVECGECGRILDHGADPPKPAAEIGVRTGKPQDAGFVPNPEAASAGEPGEEHEAVVTTFSSRFWPTSHNIDPAATGTEGALALRYDDTGTTVAAAWQRGRPLPGFEPPSPPDYRTDVSHGVRYP